MREIWVGTGRARTETSETVTCEYTIVVREMNADLGWESYGIQVTRAETGERVLIADLTVSAEKILDFALRLQRNLVTPCTVRELLEDWL